MVYVMKNREAKFIHTEAFDYFKDGSPLDGIIVVKKNREVKYNYTEAVRDYFRDETPSGGIFVDNGTHKIQYISKMRDTERFYRVVTDWRYKVVVIKDSNDRKMVLERLRKEFEYGIR